MLVIVPASMLVALVSRDLVYFVYDFQYSLVPFYLTLLVLTYLYMGFLLVVGSFFNHMRLGLRLSLAKGLRI
mgnify:CR=1 FL=1